MMPFYGWGTNVSRLYNFWGPGVLDTSLINPLGWAADSTFGPPRCCKPPCLRSLVLFRDFKYSCRGPSFKNSSWWLLQKSTVAETCCLELPTEDIFRYQKNIDLLWCPFRKLRTNLTPFWQTDFSKIKYLFKTKKITLTFKLAFYS